MCVLPKWLPRIAIAVALVAAGSYITVWGLLASKRCAGRTVAAARMRAMDERALMRLYADTRAFVASQSSPDSWGVVPGEDLPSAFSGLHAKYATIMGDDVVFMLSGCLDDKVYLHVDHDAEDSSGQVVLSPGEARASATLWSTRSVPVPVQGARASRPSVEATP